MSSNPNNEAESSGSPIRKKRFFARPSRGLTLTALSSQSSSGPVSAAAAREDREEPGPSSIVTQTTRQLLFYPNAPLFEPITKTLLRHLRYYRVSRDDTSPTRPSNAAIFASLNAELWSAIQVLHYDMYCGTCEGVDQSYDRHMSAELAFELKNLTRAIRRLDAQTWHDESRLVDIGDGFGWLKRNWKREWMKSPCAMGNWNTPLPQATHMDCYLMEGVRCDLPPFEGPGDVAARAEELRRYWEKQAAEN